MKIGAKETGGMQIREQCLNTWLEIKFRELLRFFGAWQYILPLKFFFFFSLPHSQAVQQLFKLYFFPLLKPVAKFVIAMTILIANLF